MNIRSLSCAFGLAFWLALVPSLGGCATTAPQPASIPDFRSNPEVRQFVQEMHVKHGFDSAELLTLFDKMQVNAKVLRLIEPKNRAENQPSWQWYRSRFINERNIKAGLQFWQDNASAFAAASKKYGVPEGVIAGIIGVETAFGRNTGGFGVMEALATLAFNYPPRAPFFREELEQFLLLCRENSMPPLSITGSFAGAIGIPQFMPGSQRRHAVDFDGDNKVDLRNSSSDAIGSIASFLVNHGWKAGEHIAIQAHLNGASDEDLAALVAAGLRPSLDLAQLDKKGLSPMPAATSTDHATTAFPNQTAVIDFPTPEQVTEYWLCFQNFYVITRYNRSKFYAMTVLQLGQTLAQRRGGQQQ